MPPIRPAAGAEFCEFEATVHKKNSEFTINSEFSASLFAKLSVLLVIWTGRLCVYVGQCTWVLAK